MAAGTAVQPGAVPAPREQCPILSASSPASPARALAQRPLRPLTWHQPLLVIISVEFDLPSSYRPASQTESGVEGRAAGVCRQLSLLLKAGPVSPLPLCPGVSPGAATRRHNKD